MNHDEPELWIVVRNWRRFQHYRNRNPGWIKIYGELHHDESYLSLSGEQRAILCGLWLEYSSSRCRLPLDTRSLSARLRLRVTRAQLDRLNHAGYIEYALAPRYQDASATRAHEKLEVDEELKHDVRRPLAKASEPEYEERDEDLFDFEKINYAPRKMP